MQEKCPESSCVSPCPGCCPPITCSQCTPGCCGSDVRPGVFRCCPLSCLSPNDTKLNHLFPVTHFPQNTQPRRCQPVHIRAVGTRAAPWVPAQGLSPLGLSQRPSDAPTILRELCWLYSPFQAHHEQAPRSVWDLSWQESGTHWNLSQGWV